jgi:uncharacterized protein
MNLPRQILIVLVRAYQLMLSPMKATFFGPAGRCRFTPSCSHYAIEALQVHGALAGTALATRRLCRCHPWGGCGHDPVPPGKMESQEKGQPSVVATSSTAGAFSGGRG